MHPSTLISPEMLTAGALATSGITTSTPRDTGLFDRRNYAVITFTIVVTGLLVLFIVLRRRYLRNYESRTSCSAANAEADSS